MKTDTRAAFAAVVVIATTLETTPGTTMAAVTSPVAAVEPRTVTAAMTTAAAELPSAVLPAMLEALTNGTPRGALTERVERVRTDGLAAAERYLLGEAWFVAGKPEAAYDYFAEAASSGLDHARFAASRLALIELNARQNVPEAERRVADYRQRFAPHAGDLWGLYHVVSSLAGRYRAAGDHERAVQAVLDELAWLDPELPHPSFHLPFAFRDSFREAGRGTLAAELLATARDRLTDSAYADSRPAVAECLRMEDIIDLRADSYRIGTAVRCDWSYRYEDLLEALTDALAAID